MAFLVFWINCNLQIIQNLVQDDPPMQIQQDKEGYTRLDTNMMILAEYVMKRRSVLSEY